MRVLVISNLYPPFQLGGYEIACKNVVAGLQAKGHDVLVLTSPSHLPGTVGDAAISRSLKLGSFQPVLTTHHNVERVANLESMVSNFTNTSILLGQIGAFQPDCVYCFNLVGIGGLALLDAMNVLNWPFVLHLMDVVPALLQADIDGSILSLYNAQSGDIYRRGTLLAMSNHLLEEIESLCGYQIKSSAHLVPGWADTISSMTNRNYYTFGDAKFVAAGTVAAHKGTDLIIEAAAILKSKGIQNYSIDIYGDGNLVSFVDRSKALGVADRIKFLGPRSQTELMDIYKTADVFLFPTQLREPFGFAPVEAASAGCVPIMTSTCGAAERLVGGVHCLKIKRDAESLADAMALVCAKQLNLQRMGQNGQTITREDLSLHACLETIEHYLMAAAAKPALRKTPGWSDVNLAYLKHNLANKFHNELGFGLRP